MRNMPKVIGTGKDIHNLLGMVQAGKLAAGELREAIQGIEEEKYIFSPVIDISEDKRYVTTNYLGEGIYDQERRTHYRRSGSSRRRRNGNRAAGRQEDGYRSKRRSERSSRKSRDRKPGKRFRKNRDNPGRIRQH